MIHDKMVQIQHKFKELGLTKDEHSAEFEQFIRELVHAEKYINQDLVNQPPAKINGEIVDGSKKKRKCAC